MSETAPAHQRFVEFVAAFYREAGCELPYYEFDGQSPIAFEVMVDDVRFSVGYDPAAAGDANLFVHCVFGPAPAHDGAVLRRLMERNLRLARERNATYCIDRKTQEIACYMRRNLAQVDVQALSAEMRRMAQEADEWRDGWFLRDADDGDARNDANAPAAWAMFA
jgi:hypothetical protein